MRISPELQKLMRRGCDFLGCECPVICGAMTWVSEPHLVSAVCNAGGFASLAGGNAPPDILKQQVAQIRELTSKPFGVNLITIAPNYEAHLGLLAELKIPYVIFAGSFPRKEEIEIAKASGAKVLCFASTLSIAQRMIRFGADAIILEGSEAGGHIGHVALSILLQQVLFEVRDQLPVFVAGGIATGKMLAHVMMMGAAGVQLGTSFVMTEECRVHENFKNAFKRANARDAVSTPQYDSRIPVVAVRALRNKGTDEFGKLQLKLLKQLEAHEISREQAQDEVETFWIGALRKAAIEGDIEHGSLMAGQSVGIVNEVRPVKQLLQDLLDDADGEIRRIKENIGA